MTGTVDRLSPTAFSAAVASRAKLLSRQPQEPAGLAMAIAPACIGSAGAAACALGGRFPPAGTRHWADPGTILSLLQKAGVAAGEALPRYHPMR